MTLFSQSAESIRWVLRVLGVFMRARPGITLATIICAASSQITRLMAFFLPLKVILLAGSDGVPRYFRFFIEPDDKMEWIIILSVGAVLAYVVTLILESATERLAEVGSARVLSGANQIAASRRYREKARNYFAQFCEVAAGKLFAATVLIVLAFLNTLLFGVLVGLMVIQYLAAAAVLGRNATINPNRLQRFIIGKSAEFIQICSSFNFLAGFFVILTPFLMGHEGNILVAILSVLMMRQGFNRLDGAINLMVALSMVRAQVDPLVFRDRKLERTEVPGKQAFRVLFSKQKRDEAVQRELAPLVDGQAEFHAEWQDSTIPGVYMFRIACESGDPDGIRYFQKQVYPEPSVYRLEHEELLFEYMSRETLKAPRLVSRFSQAGFECQICDYGAGEPISAGKWKDIAPELFSYFWGVEPPARLVQAYETSSNTLVGRLSESFFEGVTVAVDTDQERDILDRFRMVLPELHERLGAVPLYVVNPDLGAATVAHDGDDFCVMSWCRWSLEPIGYALPNAPDKAKLEEMVARAREVRGLDKHTLDVRHVLFTKQCRELDRMIVQEHYKKALRQMKSIMNGPVMSDV
jgi:hypothetical protein